MMGTDSRTAGQTSDLLPVAGCDNSATDRVEVPGPLGSHGRAYVSTVAAAEAAAYGWGGVRAVSEAVTGMSPHTIRKGSAELRSVRRTRLAHPRTNAPTGWGQDALHRVGPGTDHGPGKPGRPGDARRSDVTVTLDVQEYDPLGRGATGQGHPASPSTVGRLLRAAGYSLQSESQDQARAGSHPDPECPVRTHKRNGESVPEAMASRRFRSTPKRRNWSGISRTVGARVAAQRRA